ncbi:hypothetical protein KIPB_016866 [Kipferlia bialata]|uniref:Uncharacterized protein n=1 Tax=Kipferlia bialata TaxID=797122 RepID=A0A9K3GS76_9EUKA|nr:hypothetical protein KIPB_016866 [Kipferlia bialata]|eukprot:g16866.t1
MSRAGRGTRTDSRLGSAGSQASSVTSVEIQTYSTDWGSRCGVTGQIALLVCLDLKCGYSVSRENLFHHSDTAAMLDCTLTPCYPMRVEAQSLHDTR